MTVSFRRLPLSKRKCSKIASQYGKIAKKEILSIKYSIHQRTSNLVYPKMCDYACVKPCYGKTVKWGKGLCLLSFLGSNWGPCGQGWGLGLLGCGWGLMMGWMDLLANSGLQRPDLINVKPRMGKWLRGGGCVPLRVWLGPLGSWLWDLALWDLDEAQWCNGSIV